MGNASRHLAVGGARPTFGKKIDTAGAALELATDVLTRSVPGPELVEQALERFRAQTRAHEVTFWCISAGIASCILRTSERHPAVPPATVRLPDSALAAERIRRRGAVICRAGEMSGVEELAPSGNSYAVCAVPDADDVVGVLAMGWDMAEPPCDESDLASVRVAAAALLHVLSPIHATPAKPVRAINGRHAASPSVRPTVTQVEDTAQSIGEKLFDDLVDAISMPIWIHGLNGHVTYGNRAWRGFARDLGAAWTDILHADDRATAAAEFENAARVQRPFAIEVRLATAGSAYRWAVCHIAPYAAEGRVQGYVGCCCDISAQRQAERALAEVGSRLMHAQDDERSRIARELHDDLGQQTALLATQIETLRRSSKTQSARMRHNIAEASRGIQDLAVSIHNLSHELHPPKLKLLGLVKTIESLCRNLSSMKGPAVSFTTEQIPSDVSERLSLCLCRVTQEALQNAMKHSGARQIDVRLLATDQELVLRIGDNGRGFDPFSSSAGMGLVNMRERVELNGGRLLIHTSPSGGTMIEAFLPISPQV